MARVTVEDCLDNVENRFELVLVAAKRTRQLMLGSDPMVSEDRDKPTVIALREIAEGMVTRSILEEQEVDLEKELFGESEESEEPKDGIEVAGGVKAENEGLESGSSGLVAVAANLSSKHGDPSEVDNANSESSGKGKEKAGLPS